MEVTIGGERLGSGNKMKADLKTYERSTHDLSYIWGSTMSAGTLVPFMSEVALNGDTFDIYLNCEVLTHPTIGPLFGSYKVQLDVFQVPIRLYEGKLHMNMLGIGRDMKQIKLPKIEMKAQEPNIYRPLDNQQVNSSCIFSYLGIRGIGTFNNGTRQILPRAFNAIPYLGYWDIYKNDYANKSEEIGAVIHKDLDESGTNFTSATFKSEDGGTFGTMSVDIINPSTTNLALFYTDRLEILGSGVSENEDYGNSYISFKLNGTTYLERIASIFDSTVTIASENKIIFSNIIPKYRGVEIEWIVTYNVIFSNPDDDIKIKIRTFPLENIDEMRMNILTHVKQDTPFEINNATLAPYGLPLKTKQVGPDNYYSQQYTQEGLALKTYQSDLFNNWINQDWIDGTDGITQVTKMIVTDGAITIDEMLMKKKVYDMLNRINLSGGSYDDWQRTVWTDETITKAENPMYLGGLSREIVFQEVISQSATEGEPLGTLAGKGRMSEKHKGGNITAKINEPSYIMGIVSITPRLCYSQGNKWDVNLETMDDLHKPQLDEIGWQDLITDQIAWWDTKVGTDGTKIYKSAGKQPAWMNYMTNVNQVRGNFADETQQMFMVLNRRYEPNINTNSISIKDMTTYIDPAKFNHIFADTRLDSQNFWVQIGVNIEARRKMSAKIIPNL